jgi:hypothetical protein
MNIKRSLFILLVMLAQALTACGALNPQAPTSVLGTLPPPTPTSTVTPAPADPAEIVQSFYKAYNEGDVEAAMAFIADDIKCRGHCYLTGSEAFRSFIEGDMKNGAQIEISDLRGSQDKVIFNYKLYKSGSVSATGVDAVMQIKDGKIVLFEIN